MSRKAKCRRRSLKSILGLLSTRRRGGRLGLLPAIAIGQTLSGTSVAAGSALAMLVNQLVDADLGRLCSCAVAQNSNRRKRFFLGASRRDLHAMAVLGIFTWAPVIR
ncbi:hypothetical protein L596_024334 [Steinernema carpocapsae]|uniref:Uncharacterized protein n=1 Tax=Steinernema carpocapsae TaxID=34508 RepID=A0A4U5MGF9_STECR|nr:hypothetical protein L596_024334 [Steinernema carpocapsae]